MSKPLWKHRITFSKDRNIAVVLWPPGQYKGHPTPPSITLEEGKREGERWVNARMTLTLDKAPNVIQDLQLAYGKALDLEKEEVQPESEVAKHEMAEPSDHVQYLQTVILETMKPDGVYPRLKLVEISKVADWVQEIEIEQAINGLLEQGKIRPKFENLNVVGFRKA